MERIIELFKSPSTSLSLNPATLIAKESTATAGVIDSTHSDSPRTMLPRISNLEALPSEIISHILAFLPPSSLVNLSRTCALLHSHAYNDLLWMSFVRNTVPGSESLESPSPAKSWRDLYTAHHPYWFLVKNKIWFADVHNHGLLILARYNSQNGCIEAFRLLAEHGPHKYEIWAHNPEVIIHTFNPKFSLLVDDPVIKLEFKEGEHDNDNRLRKEVSMQTGRTRGICSMISLCRPIPKALQAPAMALWPPITIPAQERVRNESATKFRRAEQRPQTLDQMSDRTFRIRKWLEFSNLMQPLNAVRMGEEVMTFSTLLEESYMPTKEKPWQGIWVGDYSGHGCEFLLLLQRDVTSPMDLPRTSSTDPLQRSMAAATHDARTGLQDSDQTQQSAEATESEDFVPPHRMGENNHPYQPQLEEDFKEQGDQEVQGGRGTRGDETPSGRLEAIKLTGDVNVPRGEYTWFAEDIGPKGLIRVANEQMFVGARTVRSWGHIAGRGYRHDRFIPSQLIMISHDSLAQYWKVSEPCVYRVGSSFFHANTLQDFGHISFYKRVNVDDYLNKPMTPTHPQASMGHKGGRPQDL